MINGIDLGLSITTHRLSIFCAWKGCSNYKAYKHSIKSIDLDNKFNWIATQANFGTWRKSQWHGFWKSNCQNEQME